MKRGMILYVTEGKEVVGAHSDRPDLKAMVSWLGVDAIRLATSEEEIAYGWWQLITRGMQQVSCMKAAYNAGLHRLIHSGSLDGADLIIGPVFSYHLEQIAGWAAGGRELNGRAPRAVGTS